ncbi:MAG: flagellar biosynthesis anti-sigma factor FlgM [Methylohalobius sp.]|nr:flagellar biosynthesis anti-sigma factor FlgM [Methylohalobius sp.]
MPIDLRSVTGKAVVPISDKSQTPRANALPKSETGQTAEADSLALTDIASRLKQAQAALANAPVIDLELVARVANQLEAGTYEINAERIAEKIIEMERQLLEKER